MYRRILFLFLLVIVLPIKAQQFLTGSVYEKDDTGRLNSLVGANILWAGTNIGTTSDINGKFKIPYSTYSKKLVVSMVGYTTDTLSIIYEKSIEVILKVQPKLEKEIEVVGQQQSTFVDYLEVENKSVMTTKELYKAACCNLSESFETNPSIDVSFTDAITGAKQIEMLVLSGIYTQSTLENLPYLRGLISNVGLTFIPGSWVQAINVSKGIGSVANGFESITGQIDVDLKKPSDINDKPFFLNLYGDYDQRFEGNMNYRFMLSDKIQVINLLHYSSRQYKYDMNHDHYIDMPTFKTLNLMQRWHYSFIDGMEGQIGFQYVNDKKEGGTIHSNHYKYGTDATQFNIYGKTGYVFQSENYKSVGIQWSFNNYKNTSHFGLRNYSGEEKTGYFNFIFQSMFGSPNHKYRTGFSFLYDQLNETFLTSNFQRIERIPGIFFEYTYTFDDTFSAIAGARLDQHNYYGTMFTPRLHVRYAPQEDWVIRAVAGRGFRSSNIFTEYISAFASSREVSIITSENFGYGLQQESAWNYGLSLVHYFTFDYREGSISIDLYRTVFDKFTLANLDFNPQKLIFSSIDDGSYSNSVQVEMNFQPMERLDTRIAYRFLESKQLINNNWLDKPLSSKHRVLLNFAYSTEKETKEDPQMFYDLTIQWFDKKRIPSTSSNPTNLQAGENSPSFVLVNAQISRTFFANFDVYIGVENIFDFRQNVLIIDPMNPTGKYFDASLVWGPVNGRTIYSGLRFKL